MASWLVVATAGCGGDLVSVAGTVQREESPLAGGRVVFTPIGGGKAAHGAIQADGTFQLTTERSNDGAAPGSYRVRIIETKDTDAGRLYISYVPPRSATWDVVAGQRNELTINIRAQDGWETHQDN